MLCDGGVKINGGVVSFIGQILLYLRDNWRPGVLGVSLTMN